MSTTLSLACMTCKEKLWIGQRNYIYLDERETMEKLKEFLFKHQSSEYQSDDHVHQLQFLNDHFEPFYDGTWKDFENEQRTET